MKVQVKESEVAQSCPTLWDPVDRGPPGSSIHGISQARILEWIAISFSSQLIFQQKLYKPEDNGMIYLKWWKGRTHNQECATLQDPSSDLMGKSKKLSRQAKENTAPPNQLYNKIWRKFPRQETQEKKRPAQNTPTTIKKMVIGSYISIITLNIKGLNAPTKKHQLAGQMRTCACMHFHLMHHST